MTEPTRYASLSWIGLLLAGLIALLLWRWSIAHLPLLGDLFLRIALTVAAVLLDTSPCGVIHGLSQALAWLTGLWLAGWLLKIAPGGGGGPGKWLRALPVMLFNLFLTTVRLLLRHLGRGFFRMIWPRARRTEPTDLTHHN